MGDECLVGPVVSSFVTLSVSDQMTIKFEIEEGRSKNMQKMPHKYRRHSSWLDSRILSVRCSTAVKELLKPQPFITSVIDTKNRGSERNRKLKKSCHLESFIELPRHPNALVD